MISPRPPAPRGRFSGGCGRSPDRGTGRDRRSPAQERHFNGADAAGSTRLRPRYPASALLINPLEGTGGSNTFRAVSTPATGRPEGCEEFNRTSDRLQPRFDLLRCLRRWDDFENLEVHKIAPARDPLLEKQWVRAFHDLIAACHVGRDPARYVVQSIRRKPSLITETPVNGNCVAILEALDDHVQLRAWLFVHAGIVPRAAGQSKDLGRQASPRVPSQTSYVVVITLRVMISPHSWASSRVEQYVLGSVPQPERSIVIRGDLVEVFVTLLPTVPGEQERSSRGAAWGRFINLPARLVYTPPANTDPIPRSEAPDRTVRLGLWQSRSASELPPRTGRGVNEKGSS